MSAPELDVARLLASLELQRVDDLADLTLLQTTYTEPGAAAFWSALLDDGRLKSRVGRNIELYHDAIARHAPGGGTALSVLDARGEFRHLTFGELDAAATACAAAWSRDGLEPGAVLAMALPLGLDWLVGFAAALRLGLTVSCLGPMGPDALCRRVLALEAQRILVEPGALLPPSLASKALSVSRSGAAHAPPPRAYTPEQALGLLFSPLRGHLKPTALSAQTALLSALRDARFAYRINEQSGLATPDLPLAQHQPAVILATLLAGARFVELPVSVIVEKPALLAQPFITTIGVAPSLRDALRRAPVGALPAVRDWWRSVDEPLDWEAWRDFIAKNALAQLPVSNLLVDAASGGAELVSVRRPGSTHAFVVPAPGTPFTLTDLSTKTPTLDRVGVCSVGVKPNPKHPGWYLLAKRASEYLYGGSVAPRRAGRIFPEEDVVECATKVPGVENACVVSVAVTEPGPRFRFVLIVFAPLLESDPALLERAVERAVHSRLGADFMPDRVLVSPLSARQKNQKLDQDWCRRQYSAGFLERKATLAVFRRLSALRAAVRRDEANDG